MQKSLRVYPCCWVGRTRNDKPNFCVEWCITYILSHVSCILGTPALLHPKRPNKIYVIVSDSIVLVRKLKISCFHSPQRTTKGQEWAESRKKLLSKHCTWQSSPEQTWTVHRLNRPSLQCSWKLLRPAVVGRLSQLHRLCKKKWLLTTVSAFTVWMNQRS